MMSSSLVLLLAFACLRILLIGAVSLIASLNSDAQKREDALRALTLLRPLSRLADGRPTERRTGTIVKNSAPSKIDSPARAKTLERSSRNQAA